MHAINENRFGKLFYHLGPSRDESIFYKIKDNKTKLENSDFILCTGLFDEYEDDLNFYKDFLKFADLKKEIVDDDLHQIIESSIIFKELD